jgi:polyhydroxyalkanoate synthesis regulator phasin
MSYPILEIDAIQRDIYKILLSNENKKFNQYQLYNKFFEIVDTKNKPINAKFKVSFITAIQSLPVTYDDVYVTVDTDDNKKIYSIYYKTSNDITDEEDISEVDLMNDSLPTYNIVNEYRVKMGDIDYIDPISGNTLAHDLINCESSELLDQLIHTHKINLLCKNINGKSAIRYIKYGDQKILNLLLEETFSKIQNLENNITRLETKIIKLENKESRNDNNLIGTILKFIKYLLIFYFAVQFYRFYKFYNLYKYVKI